jgi:hypothetical protein
MKAVPHSLGASNCEIHWVKAMDEKLEDASKI